MKFVFHDKSLELQLEGVEQFWALKRKIVIDASAITNVEWVAGTVNRQRLGGLRAPGTVLPGLFYAGSFYRRSGWVFRYIKARKPGYLMITTNLRRYHNIRVTASQQQGLAVREWFNKYRQTGHVA